MRGLCGGKRGGEGAWGVVSSACWKRQTGLSLRRREIRWVGRKGVSRRGVGKRSSGHSLVSAVSTGLLSSDKWGHIAPVALIFFFFFGSTSTSHLCCLHHGLCTSSWNVLPLDSCTDGSSLWFRSRFKFLLCHSPIEGSHLATLSHHPIFILCRALIILSNYSG